MAIRPNLERAEKRLLRGYTVVLTLVLCVPVAIVLLASFNASAYLAFPPHQFSFRWYQDLFGDQRLLEALGNSGAVALFASAACTGIGMLAAMGTAYLKPALRMAIVWLFGAIAAMPVLLIALPSLILLSFEGLPRGKGAIAAVLTVVLLPIPTFVTMTSLLKIDPHIREAARLLGARWWQVELRIVFPLLRRQLLAAFFLVFLFSFDDLIVSYFLGGSVETLSTAIYSMVRFGLSPVVMAACALVYAGAFFGIACAIAASGISKRPSS